MSIFEEPEPFMKLSREEIIKMVDLLQDGFELSWVTTDKDSFEWVEVNQNPQEFMNKFTSLDWNRVHLGLFNSNTKRTRYLTFEKEGISK